VRGSGLPPTRHICHPDGARLSGIVAQMAAPGYPEPSRPMATRDRVAGMHIDRRIAILGLLGTAALAVAMMAAPLLFADLPRWLLGLMFWGGLLLAAVVIGASIIIAFRGEASEPRIGHRRRMIALFGMIIFGVGFVGSAALYFWPMRPTPISEASSRSIGRAGLVSATPAEWYPVCRFWIWAATFDAEIGNLFCQAPQSIQFSFFGHQRN